jgi:cell division protein FtsZ
MSLHIKFSLLQDIFQTTIKPKGVDVKMDFIVEKAMKQAEETNMDGLKVGQANIKVIGVGGAGNNMVNWLYKKGVKGAEIIACNTDQQHLNITESDRKFLMGRDVTRGLGCGGFPERGAEAAQENLQEIKDSLKDSDMA